MFDIGYLIRTIKGRQMNRPLQAAWWGYLAVIWVMAAAPIALGDSRGEVDERTLFSVSTPAVQGSAMVPEWEPVRALVVAVPLEGVFARAGMGVFMLDVITQAARYTDVVVLHDEEELQTVARVIAGVRGVDEDLLERVHFMPARVGTVWLRDHGPVFARHPGDAGRGLVLLDSVYRDARFEARVEREGLVGGAGASGGEVGGVSGGGAYRKMALDLAKRRNDDTTPVYLSQFLRQQGCVGAVRIARPPAQIWGGDVTTDGMGNVFVSTETLIMHGGKRAELDEILRDYYGANGVIYLEPLPGPTVKHLDMFFKVVDAGTFFLASYDYDEDEFEGAGEYARYLHGEIKRVLARNEARLRAAFPDRRIVRLPMPEVVMPTREEVVREYRDLWYTQKLLADTPSLREHLARAADPNERAAVERKITERAVQQYRIEYQAEPGSDEEFALVDRLIRENSSTTLEEAIRNYAPRRAIYKTYLNSVYIDGPHGRAVLVPDYSPDARNPASRVGRMRRDVEDAYADAFPDAEVVFVNCDTVIELSGAVHCVTVTVPALND
jgi:agmatine/peptidylarginine deiminase